MSTDEAEEENDPEDWRAFSRHIEHMTQKDPRPITFEEAYAFIEKRYWRIFNDTPVGVSFCREFMSSLVAGARKEIANYVPPT